jgi:hypothetical protein
MGWRFRQRFKVLPGVRLNLSKTGLSVSIGGAPLTLNVGPRGVYGTASLPGTGISYREHFSNVTGATHPPDSAPREPNASDLPPNPIRSLGHSPIPVPKFPTLVATSPIEEVRSSSTELLTSASLKELKELIQTAYSEQEDIEKQLQIARQEGTNASTSYLSWEKGFLLKRLFKAAFEKRKAESETASAKIAELEEQRRLTTIATHIEIAKEQAEPYFRMRDAFASLTECAAIWDIKAHQATDRFHERTTATTRISRALTKFSLESNDLIQWEQKVPHLQNAKGGDLFLYPGFILYRAARTAFSVIDYQDVKPKFALVRFQEDEKVPRDAEIVGQTWAKTNKDGSKDRRFANNYQIPIAAYGCLTFKSDSGLWEEFQFSNGERVSRFANALSAFVLSFGTGMALGPESQILADEQIKEVNAAYERLKDRALQGPSTGAAQGEIEQLFASESEEVRALVREHGRFWEYRLTKELLDAKLSAVQKLYDNLSQTGATRRKFSGSEYLIWLPAILKLFGSAIPEIGRLVDTDLPRALGKPGESGNAVQILSVAERLSNRLLLMLTLEVEITAADPPKKLNPLRDSLRGIGTGFLAEVRRLPDEIGRAVTAAQQGTREFQITLHFTSPPQLTACEREMEVVRAHPEWLS